MRSHLKVKVFTLAAEMTYIRRQEEKWKTKAKIARARQKQNSVEYAEKNFWSQRSHRDGLKTEARNTHLAYGCMKGVSYPKMEHICYGPIKGYGSSEPDWAVIESMVERFSKDETNPQDIMQKFAEWLAEAKVWYEANPERIKLMREVQLAEHTRRLHDPEYQRQFTERKLEAQQRGVAKSG